MTLMILSLLACGGETPTTDSSSGTTDTNTGPVYDNSYCEDGTRNSAQQACCDYIAAYNTCAETYGSQDRKDGESTGCEAAGAETQGTWECLESVYVDGDCTTQEGWNAAVQDAIGC